MAKNKKRAQKQPMADSSKMNNKDYLKALRELHVETVKLQEFICCVVSIFICWGQVRKNVVVVWEDAEGGGGGFGNDNKFVVEGGD